MFDRDLEFEVYFFRGSITFMIYFFLFGSFFWALFGTFLLSFMYWLDEGAII